MYSVTQEIAASPARIWSLLTDASAFPDWNSTVSRLGGRIALGEKLRLEVPLAPGRTFKPQVTVFEPDRRMQWSDGAAPMFRGVRTFTLEPHGALTRFVMEETFSGILLPMIKPSLPDFTAAFASFADDLKRASERRSS